MPTEKYRLTCTLGSAGHKQLLRISREYGPDVTMAQAVRILVEDKYRDIMGQKRRQR